MFGNVILVHRRGAESVAHGGSWLLWQTCLRKIAFGSAEGLAELALQPGDEILRGADAYRLCLEIVCGLHSPLVGETEVLGQFKNTIDSWELPESPWGLEMQRFVRAILEDAKKVRSTFLGDLGSQSYGSLLRRELRSISEIHMFGAGHLAGEILPWLCKDGIDIHVHVRDLARAADLRARYPQAKFHVLPDIVLEIGSQTGPELAVQAVGDSSLKTIAGALILAAPVSDAWLVAWRASRREISLRAIVDLRGKAAGIAGTNERLQEILGPADHVSSLNEVMERITANQEAIEARRAQALAAIGKLVQTRDRHIEYRPFGWEDVCA